MIYLDSHDIVLFSGDSITDGNRGHSMDCNHIFGHGYQYTAASQMALDNCERMPKFINKGYSGYRFDQILDLWETDVIENNPTMVSILAGANDVAAASSHPRGEIAERCRANLCEMIRRTREALPDTKLILCEPFYLITDNYPNAYEGVPHPEYEPYFKPLNYSLTKEEALCRKEEMTLVQKAVAETAKEQHCIFVPLQDALDAYAAKARPSYFVWDNIHPTMAGHALIAKQWLSCVEAQL
ncbi:MAG: GDSL-type esterase/lipase family protein [Clostridia bacterium]|nr:GDSL-type esterase/lipase family protein [Clostridia bacterium]